MLLFTAAAEVNGMEDEEEEEEEVMLEEENMEAEHQMELKGAQGEVRAEGADAAPGPSRLAETPQRPDQEQAGLQLVVLLLTVAGITCGTFHIGIHSVLM